MNIDYISDLIETYKSSSEYINTLMCDSEKDLQQFGVTKESLIAEKSVYNEVIHDLEHIVLTYSIIWSQNIKMYFCILSFFIYKMRIFMV